MITFSNIIREIRRFYTLESTPVKNRRSTVWKNEEFSLSQKIFREINSFVTSQVKPLLSRKFCEKV